MTMKLSIIIPVFNEEKTILEVLKNVTEVNIPNIKKEIIVVDDGSSDTTALVISSFESTHSRNEQISNLKVLKHKKNQGKGVAVRTGLEYATGEYIVIQDADLEYNPKDIVKLLDPIQKRNAVVVYGTRLRRLPNFKKDERTTRFLIHYLGNRFLSFLTSILYGQWVTDMETGYKIFPKKVGESLHLHAKSFDLEPEITAKLLKSGYKILEISIGTNPRGYKEGKKLNTFKDGFKALWTLIKYRFTD